MFSTTSMTCWRRTSRTTQNTDAKMNEIQSRMFPLSNLILEQLGSNCVRVSQHPCNKPFLENTAQDRCAKMFSNWLSSAVKPNGNLTTHVRPKWQPSPRKPSNNALSDSKKLKFHDSIPIMAFQWDDSCTLRSLGGIMRNMDGDLVFRRKNWQ